MMYYDAANKLLASWFTGKRASWAVIVCNAVSGFSGLRSGAIVNGKLSFGPCASLLFCAAFIIIMISLKMKASSSDEDDLSEDEI